MLKQTGRRTVLKSAPPKNRYTQLLWRRGELSSSPNITTCLEKFHEPQRETTCTVPYSSLSQEKNVTVWGMVYTQTLMQFSGASESVLHIWQLWRRLYVFTSLIWVFCVQAKEYWNNLEDVFFSDRHRISITKTNIVSHWSDSSQNPSYISQNSSYQFQLAKIVCAASVRTSWRMRQYWQTAESTWAASKISPLAGCWRDTRWGGGGIFI
jgi:hypothetical protein